MFYVFVHTSMLLSKSVVFHFPFMAENKWEFKAKPINFYINLYCHALEILVL